MVHRATILVAATAVCAFCILPQAASAQYPAGPGDYYYTYVCPGPVPPVVGYTYITYPALAPHQFLGCCHCECFKTCNCDGSVTHTCVHYNHCLKCCSKPTVMWGVPVPHTPPAKAGSTFCMP
jgi:hypothetical protein